MAARSPSKYTSLAKLKAIRKDHCVGSKLEYDESELDMLIIEKEISAEYSAESEYEYQAEQLAAEEMEDNIYSDVDDIFSLFEGELPDCGELTVKGDISPDEITTEAELQIRHPDNEGALCLTAADCRAKALYLANLNVMGKGMAPSKRCRGVKGADVLDLVSMYLAAVRVLECKRYGQRWLAEVDLARRLRGVRGSLYL